MDPETATAPSATETAAALRIAESIQLEESGGLDADGTVLLHVLRPCVGKGRGSHLYESEMLKTNASKFKDWKMYLNHDAPEARRARKGLPRNVQELGGRVIESWWDGDVPPDPDRGFDQGAVVAKVRPVLDARKIIEEDPGLIEASINAHATAVKPVLRGGKRVWLVEGIEDHGSVDWVTEAGAGGRVASLLESSYHRTRKDEETDIMDTLSDQELVAHLRETRPELIEALTEGRKPTEDEETTPVTPPKTEPAAAPKAPEKTPGEILAEALGSEEGKAALDAIVDAKVAASVSETETRLEEAISEERDLLRAESRGEDARRRQVERMQREAHSLVEAAHLPGTFADDLKDRFRIGDDGKPTPSLDLLDKLDLDGHVEEAAEDRLSESVKAEIERSRSLIASVNPTRVRGQGSTTTTTKTEDGEVKETSPAPLHSALLQEAGFEDVADLWNDN